MSPQKKGPVSRATPGLLRLSEWCQQRETIAECELPVRGDGHPMIAGPNFALGDWNLIVISHSEKVTAGRKFQLSGNRDDQNRPKVHQNFRFLGTKNIFPEFRDGFIHRDRRRT